MLRYFQNNRDKKDLLVHKKNILDSKKYIGYNSLGIYDFPDNRFDTVPLLDIIKVIEKEKNDFKPDLIFTHHEGDVNIDHKLTFQSVITACRPLKNEVAKNIICFETPSGTEWQPSSNSNQFIPNFFVSLSKKNIDSKINAMECYEFEKRAFPHPRSPKALKLRSQYWGMISGSEYAEPFNLIRSIN